MSRRLVSSSKAASACSADLSASTMKGREGPVAGPSDLLRSGGAGVRGGLRVVAGIISEFFEQLDWEQAPFARRVVHVVR